MKVGIFTLPLHTNYGGILQAYALQTVLQRLGHEVYVIEKRRRPLRLPLWRMPVKYARRLLRNIAGNPYPIFYEQKYNREFPLIRQHTDKFINSHINFRLYDSYRDIPSGDFDAIVVGSDQVWRPQQCADIRNSFLDFAVDWNIRRIAYAASFGTDEWEYSGRQTRECAALLRKFDAVSVREQSGVSLCNRHFGVAAENVLDPTMLLDKSDYERLSAAVGAGESKGTLLNYILDETPAKQAFISRLSADTGLVPFRVNSKVEDVNAPLDERIQPPVEQWLRGFHDARLVVTDSFHACVFSIIFNKPFFAIGNKGRGLSRFRSLLSVFGMEHRLLDADNLDVAGCRSACGMDWPSVNETLAGRKAASMQFLRRLL